MAHNARNTRIAAWYAEIKKLIDSASYSKIIKTANKIINDEHNQPEAWLCKVVAYIQMNQFKDAVSSILKAPNKQQMQYEMSYCQYRLNNVKEALAALETAPDKDSTRSKELKAQILYRLEQHNECYAVYRELLRSTSDDLDMERGTNMAAVQVHRTMHAQCTVPAAPGPGASYEQWYNSGCAALAGPDADTSAALDRLAQALEQCKILLEEEGAAEEELQQEQAIIRVQRGYALQVCGRDKEASTEYSTVLQHKPEDPALLAILHNNMAAANKDTNVFDTRKKMKATQIPDLEHKLTSLQKDQLALNNCIIAYHTQQPQQEETTIIQECDRLLSPSSSASHDVKLKALQVLAASLARAGQADAAVERLNSWAQNHPEDSTVTRLVSVQLRLMKSDVSGAVSELQRLPPATRHLPGVVGSLVTLLTARRLKGEAGQVFKEAANWYRDNKMSSHASVSHLLRRAAEHHLKEGDPRVAAAALEQLREAGSEDADTCLPTLIQAYAQFDPVKAQELSHELPDPSLSQATGASVPLDADTLEVSLGPKYFMKAALKMEEKEGGEWLATTAGAATDEKPSRVKPRKKKKRKTVLPKSYVTGVIPDPERWLPRWQRKNTGVRRRRGDRRKGDVGRGTQGGTGDAADKYDITKNPGQYKSTTVQQQPEPAGPRRNMPRKKTGTKKK